MEQKTNFLVKKNCKPISTESVLNRIESLRSNLNTIISELEVLEGDVKYLLK